MAEKKVSVSLEGRMDSLSSTLQRAENETERHTRAMTSSFGRVDSGILGVGRSLGGLALGVGITGASITAFTWDMVKAGLAAEKMGMLFKAAAGSAAAGTFELGYVRDLSDKLGLSFQSTALAYGKFLASTRNTSIEGIEARKVFEGVSEASTALGLSTEETSGIFLALSQMMSKGKVSAEELTGQLNERLPGATKMAADSLGVTTAELLKMMQEGKVMSSDLLPKLAAELHKTYGAAAEEASKKGQAGINRFNNEVKETARLIGTEMLPAINDMATALAAALKQWRTEGPGGLSNFSAALLPGGGSLSERFTLPKPGEAMGFRERNARIATASVGATGGADPQMSRVEAERRDEQARTNAARAKAEKEAADKAEREKGAQSRAAKEKAARTEGMKVGEGMLDLYYKDLQERVEEARKTGEGMLEAYYKDLAQNAKEAGEAGAGMADLFWQNRGEVSDETSMLSRWAGSRADSDRDAGLVGNRFAAERSAFGAEGDGGLQLRLDQIQMEQDAYTQSWVMMTDSFEVEAQRRFQVETFYDKQRADLRKTAELSAIQQNVGYAQMGINAASAMMTNLNTLTKGKSKELQIAMKAVNMSMAIANTALGVTKALAEVPYPYDFVVAGMIAAAGATQLGVIASSDSGMGGAGVTPYGAGTPSSPVVTQPALGSSAPQQGNVTIQINTLIGDDHWVQNNLIPMIKQAGSRGVTIEYGGRA